MVPCIYRSVSQMISERGTADIAARDRIRYEYDHSILPYEGPESTWNAEQLRPGHRISIMVRVSDLLLCIPAALLTKLQDAASQAATL